MPKKVNVIPINAMLDDAEWGIAIERLLLTDLSTAGETWADAFGDGKQSHRHDSHSFHFVEKGTISVDIDFQNYTMEPSSIIYIHPDQVHRTTAFNDVTVSSLAISNENLNPAYLALLEDITPAKPLVLLNDAFALLSDAVSLCLKLAEQKQNKLHHSLLKDSCNALVALVISQYLEEAKPAAGSASRFETVTKAFRRLLERSYATAKRPAEYARQLNLSISYLNECVKNTTGYSVSHHIQQRVVLEAKRLLYHSGKSVKEIAAELGYDDYPYFSRLFVKIAGMTPVVFRNKNRD